ncbi:MAG: SRPBCC domain-containing protein, partial [Gemmatimonadota bacterium]
RRLGECESRPFPRGATRPYFCPMRLTGRHTFDGPREAVWDMLLDPAVLARAFPGRQELHRSGPGRYRGRVHLAIGALPAGAFAVRVDISDESYPERYTMRVRGDGLLGNAAGHANVRLEAQGPDTTLMDYECVLVTSGAIGLVGQHLLGTLGGALARSGLRSLGEELEIRRVAHL